MIDERNEFIDYVSNVAYSIPMLFGLSDSVNPFNAKKSSQALGVATMYNIYAALCSNRQSCAGVSVVSTRQLEQEYGIVNKRSNKFGHNFALLHKETIDCFVKIKELFNDKIIQSRLSVNHSGLQTNLQIEVEPITLENLFNMLEFIIGSTYNAIVRWNTITLIEKFDANRSGLLWLDSSLWTNISQSSGLRPENQQQILRNNQRLLASYAIHLERRSDRC